MNVESESGELRAAAACKAALRLQDKLAADAALSFVILFASYQGCLAVFNLAAFNTACLFVTCLHHPFRGRVIIFHPCVSLPSAFEQGCIDSSILTRVWCG